MALFHINTNSNVLLRMNSILVRVALVYIGLSLAPILSISILNE